MYVYFILRGNKCVYFHGRKYLKSVEVISEY